MSETNNPQSTESKDATPPNENAFNLGEILFKIIQNVDDLRTQFNGLGSEKNDRFLDLITARLMNNATFVETVSNHIIQKAVAMRAQSAHPAKPSPEDHVQTVLAEDGTPMEVRVKPKTSISVKYCEFEGSQGYVEVELSETGEDVVGGTMYPRQGMPRQLNPELSFDAALIQAVNQNYRHITTHEPIMHIERHHAFWYLVEYFNGDPHAPIESNGQQTVQSIQVDETTKEQ